ncbi:DUF58 domain-containing protein [Marinagarivorans cellulosilyticus]|uniref:DUF58 domain-containing protein n=1 Tax=Marinagarivorans cellulosilyticus TaxID=2721545 RepID=A0AAN1WG39_9GAMM|nr:DUF58 domain-containing protein [Marinagarivorans cellulosilyticus]BCD96966.1 hypothetical protein MARGE09_P1166 [Marinagarivorans cellulosilyticus]
MPHNNNPSHLAIPEHWQQRFYRVAQLRYIVCLLLLVLCFIAWNRGLALLYGVVAMLLATITLSAIVPWVYLARLQARFLTIPPVHAGSDQTIALRVQAKKTVYGITLKLAHNASTNPAIEEDNHQIAYAQAIGPQADTIIYQTPTRQRGHIQLSHIDAQCAYPFGLFHLSKTISAQATTQTVYPRLISIRTLPSLWLNGANQCDAYPRQQQHGDDLFLGLRDYRYGDQYRRIDWRASARRGDIKVREFEQLEQPSLLLVINNADALNIGEGERNALEHSLSLAASLADYALRQGFNTVYTGACNGKITSSQQLTDFYQQLAELTPQPQQAEYYALRVEQALAEHSRASIAISFALAPITSSPPQQQKHWQCIFDSQSYLKPLMRARSQSASVQGNHVMIPIRASDNLERLFNDK